jgi:hypothetical protein
MALIRYQMTFAKIPFSNYQKTAKNVSRSNHPTYNVIAIRAKFLYDFVCFQTMAVFILIKGMLCINSGEKQENLSLRFY